MPPFRRELAHGGHPDLIVLPPLHFLVLGPADPERAVARHARLVVLLERRMQVVRVPGQVLRVDQIARRLVGGHRRAPRDAFRHHVVEQLRELGLVEVRLRVELAGAAEAVNLVGVVHLRRKVLDAVERGVGDAVEVLDAVDADVDEIARGRFADRDVHGRRQADLLRFVERGRRLIAIHRADQLDAVGAALLGRAHERAVLRRRLIERLARLHAGWRASDRARCAARRSCARRSRRATASSSRSRRRPRAPS